MSRAWRGITAAALLAAAVAAPVEAQVARRAPAFELGVYGGGSWSSDWLGLNEDFSLLVGGDGELDGGFGFGFAPAFGATASWFFTPTVGVRLHGGYIPSDFPTRDQDEDVAVFGTLGNAVVAINGMAEDDTDYPLNNYLADLSLVFRPWIQSRAGLLASTYLFLGGGVWMTDVAGDADAGGRPECVTAYEAIGACLPYQRNFATVGQATAGLGFDLFPLGPLGLFGEVAVHGYDSPFHVPDDADVLSEDRFAVTPRAVLGLKLGLGNLAPAPVAVPVAPVPAPAPAPAPTRPAEERIRVCVVENGALTTVDALYSPATGDTVVERGGVRRAFAAAYPVAPPAYAEGETWFVGNEPVQLGGREYVRFGVPRIISPTQLTRVGEVRGVAAFAETGAAAPHPVLYVPLRPGCQFQPYQLREQIRVRG